MAADRKGRKQLTFDRGTLHKAKRILRAKTDAEAIHRALEVITENEQLDLAQLEFANSKGRNQRCLQSDG
jgi:hypothetical protein